MPGSSALSSLTAMKIGAALAAAVLAAAPAGCGDGAGKAGAFEPQEIGRHDRCHLCGMAIRKYPGPKAEISIKDSATVLKFCSVRDAFTFARQPENARRLKAFVVEDMEGAPWEDHDGRRFIPAADASYAWEGSLEGAMGTEPVPFAARGAAEAFVKKWGGRVVSEKDITLSLLENE